MIDIILYPILVGIIIYGIVIARMVMTYQNKEVVKDIEKETKSELKPDQIPPPTSERPTVMPHSSKNFENTKK